MAELYIGLMSGTSADGVDAVLVNFQETRLKVLGTHYYPYPQALREQIFALCKAGDNEILRLGELDIVLGKAFADAVNTLLKTQSLTSADIKAIGSHGQTIRHCPNQPNAFTLQIGDPNTIAACTGITTVADFRRKDLAVGGQGAPLVPAFHQHVFAADDVTRVIVNIGGIANITVLDPEKPHIVLGYDTGPGNVLLDSWIYSQQNKPHDAEGKWGAQGSIDESLLCCLLEDAYFHLPPPKSTGREYFNLSWLQQKLQHYGKVIRPVDVQATLVELTARSILDAVWSHGLQGDIFVCGGGLHNALLMQRLQILAAPRFTVNSTQTLGIAPDWVEAIAFAWLAYQTLRGKPGNLPSVTGAKQAAVLGGIYYS